MRFIYNKIFLFLFKNKLGGSSADNMSIQAMKNVPGNHACADCDAASMRVLTIKLKVKLVLKN